jgi:RNA polymerase sigma factor (sigma-70 family)
MNTPVPIDEAPKSFLAEISTRWAVVCDPLQFVLRYAKAIQRYLTALVGNGHDADEIAQDFLLKIMEGKFDRVASDQGRFRFYLKQAVRNAVREHERKRRPVLLPGEILDDYATEETADSLAEQQWVEEWRQCILDRAWSALESHQRRHAGNLFYTALRLMGQDSDRDSAALAESASQQSGRTISAEAFRQQVSRGRRYLAKLIHKEVAATLEHPSNDAVQEELTNLGLRDYVAPYLSQADGD